MASAIFALRSRMVFKVGYKRLKSVSLLEQNCKNFWGQTETRYTSSITLPDNKDSKLQSLDVTVKYNRGLPHVIVPLPSRNEKCQFVLRPISHNVGDFLQMLRAEDRGIDRAAIVGKDGIRIAAACSIENLMDNEFWLHINDKQYHVQPPERTKSSLEGIDKVGDIQILVAQLYEALHVGEHQVRKERELFSQLEKLNEKIGPYEDIKSELAMTAERKTNVLTWFGLGLMGVQFGILARLTWWEYSWDIMEPVTYFVTYGTAMAAYAYYCLTKQEYNLPDVKDRQFLITLHKKAQKKGFNIDEYNNLKRQIAVIENDLQRLRDPLYLRASHNMDLKKSMQLNADAASSLETDLILNKKSFFKSASNFAEMVEMAAKKLKK